MPGKASSLKSPPLIGCYYLTTLRTSDLNDNYKESCYFNVDHFEDCYCTDGHEIVSLLISTTAKE